MPSSRKPKPPGRGGAPAEQRERAATTRATLIASARLLFAEAGYHATGTTEIVAHASVTRGALYHHFAGKEDLFAAVFSIVEGELVAKSNASVAGLSGDLWHQVSGAFRRYLQLVASEPEYQRILLIDGPVVLGWTRWRALQSEFVAEGAAEALRLLMNQKMVAPQPTEPLAYMLQAALNDAALAIANSDQPEQTSREVTEAFLSLLHGLRCR